MESNKTIEWQVSSDHISTKPLGYKVEVAEDSLFRRICFVHNTFSSADNFTYDDQTDITPHFVKYPSSGISSPNLGQTIRLEYDREKLMKFMAVSKGEVLQRVSPDGERIIETIDTSFVGTNYLSIDESNNDIWLTTSDGLVAICSVPFNSTTIRSLPVGTDCLACVPDGFRKVFWEVSPWKLKLKRISGETVKEWDFSLKASSVMSSQVVTTTGGVYFSIKTYDSNSLSDRFFVFCEFSGNMSEFNSVDIGLKTGCISKWGSDSVITGGDGTELTKWVGNSQSTLADLSSIGVSSVSAISSRLGETIYIVDRNDIIMAINPAIFSKLWEKQLPIQNITKIGAAFGASDRGRPILFCDDLSAGIIRDFISEGVVMAETPLEGSGDALADFGMVNRVAIAHIRISPLYERLGIIAVESSSTSTQSASTPSSQTPSSQSESSTTFSSSSTHLDQTSTTGSQSSMSESTQIEFSSSLSSISSFQGEEGQVLAVTGQNGFYAASYDFGQTWVKKTFMSPTEIGMKIIMSGNGNYQSIMTQNRDIWSSLTAGGAWQKNYVCDLVGTTTTFLGGDCSSNGKYQTFSFWYNNGLFAIVSSDFGVTWSKKTIASSGVNYYGILSVSKDGKTQIAGATNKLYRSVNYGQTWSQYSTIGTTSEIYIRMTGDNSLNRLAMMTSGGDIRTSNNQGLTWVKNLDIADTSPIGDISASEDNRTIMFGTSGSIRVSRDYGTTWAIKKSFSSLYDASYAMSVSKTGRYALSAERKNTSYWYVILSSDYGNTWVSINPSPDILVKNTNKIYSSALSTGVDIFYTSSESSLNMSSLGTSSSSMSSGYFTDITTPAQTSGTVPFIVTSDSEVTGTGDAWRAFDHKVIPPSNVTGVNCWKTPVGVPKPHWIMMNFGATNKKVIQHYNIRCCAHATSSYPQQLYIYSPTGWIFQGSNDGTNFVNLDFQQLQDSSWGSSSSNKFFSFSNSTPYQYYRLYVMYVHKGTNSTMPDIVQIEELRFSE